jgi:hypothetical protein
VCCHYKGDDGWQMESEDEEEEVISGNGDEPPNEQEAVSERLRRRKKVSPVWEHYSAVNGARVCNHCQREFSMTTSTSSLQYHIKKDHKEHGTDDGSRRPFSAKRADILVGKFIVGDCLALRIGDSKYLRELLAYLKPGYRPPAKARLRRMLNLELRARVREAMLVKIKAIGHFSSTLDSWTSGAMRAYLTVTLHGASPSFELESFVLDVMTVKSRETAQYIASAVEDVIHEWGIDRSKIVALTSDGANNMSCAVNSHLKMTWIYCLAHVINLCVRLSISIPAIKVVMKAAKAICRTFRRSSIAKRALEEKQRALGLPVRTLKIDNKTRWGSAYLMLVRLTESRAAVSACLATLHGLRRPVPDDLSSAQWDLVTKIASVLEPLQDATEFLSHEKHPTIGAAMPIIKGTLADHLKVNNADGDAIKQSKTKLADHLSLRWDIVDENASETFLVSVYLDPRFKDFRFIEDDRSRRICVDRAVEAIERLANGLLLSRERTEEEEGTSSAYVDKTRRLFGKAAIAPPTATSTEEERKKAEMDRYRQKRPCATFGEPLEPHESPPLNDPLAWWKARQSKYPHLSMLARRFLSVTCCSVPSERTFSKCGWIVNKRRCSLSDKSVALLAFLSCNRAHLPNEMDA